MVHKKSELAVITKAKDLCSYVMTVTQKSPKQFRFTFTSRMQNLSLDVIENLYRANDTFVTRDNPYSRDKRLELQHRAMTSLKLLTYFSLLAREQTCILPKQYEQISRQATDCMNLLGAWINSDRKRLQT
ncbi:MAG: four helix bundle protein [Clostridiales bacterium]|nr:four helix bundle protein [Clostridiales bacterium]